MGTVERNYEVRHRIAFDSMTMHGKPELLKPTAASGNPHLITERPPRVVSFYPTI